MCHPCSETKRTDVSFNVLCQFYSEKIKSTNLQLSMRVVRVNFTLREATEINLFNMNSTESLPL